MNAIILGIVPLIGGLSVFIVRWFASPYFVYKQVTEKLKGQPRREILKKVVDEVMHGTQYCNGKTTSYPYRRSLIERLISISDDFKDESDVESICQELDKARHGDPFAKLECKYGIGAFKGKRLDLLQDARVTDYDINDEDNVLNYIYSVWGDKNGIKEPTI